MDKLNENIFHQYNKWKEGYTRKENSFKLKVKEFLSNRTDDAHIFYISEDGKHLNAHDDVYINDKDIHDGKLAIQFGEVKGRFSISSNSLVSLEGAPEYVGGITFNCSHCIGLTSLIGAPKKVKGKFECYYCTSF